VHPAFAALGEEVGRGVAEVVGAGVLEVVGGADGEGVVGVPPAEH
jgi:hypothetical protein